MSEQNTLINITNGSKDHYMPQLDTLRALAIVQVLFSHWFIDIKFFTTFPFADTGVILFFVLSGFLITKILLSSREVSEIKNQSRIHSVKQFYVRRFLRIFPIYYLTLFILFYFNFQSVRENFIWYLSYASNIFYFKTASWGASLSHLWTLAVEEQFYIIWPFIILFIPKKHLLKSIIAIILIGPVSRAVMFSIIGANDKSYFINLLTPTCMDCFGIGALLAYSRFKNANAFEFKSKISKVLILINVLLMIIFTYYRNELFNLLPFKIDIGLIYQIFFRLIISVISLYLISKASLGFTGFLKTIFENNILTYLGKISYGLYLYHNFIPSLYKYFKLPPINNLYVRFAVQLILLVIISSSSWYLLEKPINNLKKYFKYN